MKLKSIMLIIVRFNPLAVRLELTKKDNYCYDQESLNRGII